VALNARFYAPDAAAPGDVIDLPADEAQHLTRVLRLKAGDAVRVFNGRGDEFEARVEGPAKAGVRVRIGSRHAAASEAGVAITLAQAVLKGDKMDDVVRDAVMMGVASIQPIVTARAEVKRATIERSRRRERWERIAVSSAKQCGRAVVPHIRPTLEFSDLLAALTDMRMSNPAVMLVEPGASGDAIRLSELAQAPPREVTVLIGPEGGWAEEEIRRGADACHLVTMGARTLRADAMAIVALAALFSRWKEF
jgi:16S rRNA (uracil1498-N3)-methyltransferase